MECRESRRNSNLRSLFSAWVNCGSTRNVSDQGLARSLPQYGGSSYERANSNLHIEEDCDQADKQLVNNEEKHRLQLLPSPVWAPETKLNFQRSDEFVESRSVAY
jgi:hypothetical protein